MKVRNGSKVGAGDTDLGEPAPPRQPVMGLGETSQGESCGWKLEVCLGPGGRGRDLKRAGT